MRAEHIKACIREDTWYSYPTRTRLEAVASMAQMALWEGLLLVELTWNTMILLLKGQGEYGRIGLVDVIWKIIASIINTRLRFYVSLHNALN